jgi:hypothetical protein
MIQHFPHFKLLLEICSFTAALGNESILFAGGTDPLGFQAVSTAPHTTQPMFPLVAGPTLITQTYKLHG